MEWYWKAVLVIVCGIIVAMIKACWELACSDDKVNAPNTTSLSTTVTGSSIASRPIETELLRPTNYPVSMPMSNRGTLLPLEPVSANNPYPPFSQRL
ncbi:hypothetical protein FQR65_LT03029 [Abscondita terminalis]|nr:hypothetical protein FQR65_LT03029 [Abscondita terminalis]